MIPFKSTDLDLVAWVLCQDGTELTNIQTVVRGSRLQSTFFVDLAGCRLTAGQLLNLWNKGEAVADAKMLFQRRREVLKAMKDLHKQLEGDSDAA